MLCDDCAWNLSKEEYPYCIERRKNMTTNSCPRYYKYWKDIEKKEEKKCICSIKDLMLHGCTCGAIK